MSQTIPDPEDYPLQYPTASPTPVTAARPSPMSWLAPLALVTSLLAAVAAGWALFRPAPSPVTTPPAAFANNAAADDAKDTACKAFVLVAKGVALQSQRNLGSEPVALETVAANTRLAMSGGAAYLLDKVPSNTPKELAEPLAKLSDQLQDISQNFFAGQTSGDPEQSARLAAADATSKKIIDICK